MEEGNDVLEGATPNATPPPETRRRDRRRVDGPLREMPGDTATHVSPTAETGWGDPAPSEGALDFEPRPEHARYVCEETPLGRGGQGVVYRAVDRELGRDVALKTLRRGRSSPEAAERFLKEARATAALEHPYIVPIHDVGRLADGRPFYTMRLITGRTFAAVLNDLRRGVGESDWTLVRLVQVVQHAALALQAAHERKVLHRDVKPGNIMLGEQGEVLVVDWGIAKSHDRLQTSTGVPMGTPTHMSPEQHDGERLDGRADVFALGVVLYEALTLALPWTGSSYAKVSAAIVRDEPRPFDLASSREVPAELQALVLRALAKDRRDRVASARELHDGLQAWLEGQRDRAKRRQVAEELHEEGRRALEHHEAATRQVSELAEEIARLESVHPPWQPIAEKRPLLDARRSLEDAESASRQGFLEAVNRFTDALAHVPDHADVRGDLAHLFFDRLVDAERVQDRALTETYLALVQRFHDGRFARELDGAGSVEVDVWPTHAEWTLHPQIERDLVLVDGPAAERGRGRVRLPSLPMGSYVLIARADGCEPARYPIAIFRNTDWRGELRLLPAGSIPDGYVYIPGTEAWLGGDPLATNSWPLRKVWVDSFLMKKHPVTFGEYCEFLDAVGDASRVPTFDNVPLCVHHEGSWTPNGVALWTLSDSVAFGESATARLPVMAVTYADAETYARVFGAALPTAAQWELASRGVDRRVFPWGLRFDAGLCHVRESFERPDTAPVGSRPSDRSVYGVSDLAGCMQELTASWADTERGLLEVRGGGWLSGITTARSAWRGLASRELRNNQLGFRLARSLPSD